MASPHSPYPHSGPGPSSYYPQQSPPPSHYVYGNHSPAPGPNPHPYQYQYPVPPLPPHMNGHHQAIHHQQPPSPARMNGRGGGYLAHSSPRAGQSYQNFHPHQHQQPFPHPHPSQLVVQSPHPQHPAQANPYAQPPSKYPQAYSPPYSFQPPPASYSPSWAAQQTLSPLPKQLSMPPPRGVSPLSPTYYNHPPPPPIQSPPPVVTTPNLNDPTAPLSSSPSPNPSSSSHHDHTETVASSKPSPPSSPHPHRNSSVSPQPPPSPRPSTTTSIGGWAIWSRRPHDPSHAPGIIISPRARPPPDIVQQALEMPTPPATPIPSPVISMNELPPSDLTQGFTPSTHEDGEEVDVSQSAQPDTQTSSYAPSTSHSTSVPSSSTTETTDTPTLPGSPASTNTSISLAGTPAREIKPETQVTSDAVASDEQPEAVLPSTSLSPPSSEPVSTPSAPVPPVKKSWASLLRPATPSSATGSSSSAPNKNTLPTSSVVGFSIPASSPSPALPVLPSKKSDLHALLTTGPSATSSASGGNIRPRGLVNTGNMCFANSVLQVLVYCPPFHRLFVDLGKLLLGPVVGASEKEGGTPLIDATVEFVKEFVGGDGKEGAETGTNMVVNGGRGKGKERERERAEEDDWEPESFIPTYVYDALKDKKRFDHMRGGHQEDAEEFLGFYLDTLEEEMLSIINLIAPARAGKTVAPAPVEEKEEAAPPQEDGWMEVGKRNRTVVTRTMKTTESPITRIFGGKFRSTLRAPHQKDSVIVEDWRSLRIDIQREQIHTIQDALSYISHPQSVQVTHSTRPGVTIDASQQVLIEALPPILVLHIKRFCYDTSVGGVVKVGKQVRFGPELEIGSDVMAPTAKRPHVTRYKLFGAVYHHGLSASGGHYTLDVLHPNRYPSTNPTAKPREGWVRIDDELVSDVRPDDVFGASERDDSRCAYLLFYRRVGASPSRR